MVRHLVLISLLLAPLLFSAQGQDCEVQLERLYQKSQEYSFVDRDSSYFYHYKAYRLTESQQDWESAFWLMINWNRSAAFFYDLGQLEDNITLLDSLSALHEQQIAASGLELLFKSSLDYDKGIYHYEISDYAESRAHFENIIHRMGAVPDLDLGIDELDLLSAAYGFMAKMYTNEGKYDLAKTYYNKNIRLIKLEKSSDIKSLYRYYSLLAEVYGKEKKYEASNKYFIRSLRYGIKNKLDKKTVITEAGHIIENHLNLSQLDSANYYLALLESELPKNHPFEYKYHQAKAKVLLKENKPKEALPNLQAALSEIKAKWDHKKHVEVAMAYMEIGDLFAKTQEFKKARDQYNLALGQLQTYNRTERLKVLNRKASVLNHLKLDPYFTEALNTVQNGLSVLDTLKPGFSSQDDKLLLIEDVFPLFESGLEAAFAKFGATHDRRYLKKAFHFMEKSKSNLLLDALLSARATQFAGIPKNLLEREQQLKAEIANNEKKITLDSQNSPIMQENLFRLKEAHRKLIHRFETDFPNYFDLRYNLEVIGLDQVQDQIKDDQMLLTYFYGNTHIYVLGITENKIYFNQIKTDSSFVDRIKKWVSALADPTSAPAFVNDKGYKLYEKLLAPALRESDIKKITIIADGPLNYIPFSALSTDPEVPAYLIEKYTLSYASSATLLDNMNTEGKAENTILAIAPGFNYPVPASYNDGHLLSALPNSKREIESIAVYFPDKSFSGSRATLENFRSNASAYSMIHLATHALVNNAEPEYSFLAFAPQGDGESLLYIRDLYDMKIPADLVTLSACETGIGELKRGEGMISLSRAFFYSGAKSLINTLWNINDNSATAIMGDFYKNLSEGQPKDEALRSAKLIFIEKHKEDNLSHPYYWSAFVVSGNTAPIVENSRFWWIFALILLILVVFGWFFYERRKRFREKHGRKAF